MKAAILIPAIAIQTSTFTVFGFLKTFIIFYSTFTVMRLLFPNSQAIEFVNMLDGTEK